MFVMEMVFCIQFKDRTRYPRFEDTCGSIVSYYFDLKILSLICSLRFPCAAMQLFGLNYRGIIDPMDLEWYTAILEECKSLDINDFLHNVSPYVVNRTLPPQRAASSNVSDSSRPAAVPRRRLVETDIFGSGETARERSSAPRQDTLNLGTFLGEGSHEFNQFETMRGGDA
jgi:hypothetical protein